MYNTYKTPEEAEQAAFKYVEEHVFIEFGGMNCNDYLEERESACLGWDGQDKRCSCGNRRVSWLIDKNADGTYSFLAEAY